MLNNRVYLGEAVHKGEAHRGEHQAIVSRDLWDKDYGVLKESPRKRGARTRTADPCHSEGTDLSARPAPP